MSPQLKTETDGHLRLTFDQLRDLRMVLDNFGRHSITSDMTTASQRLADALFPSSESAEEETKAEAKVVTLCGSMRFFDKMLTVAAEETAKGHIVIAPFSVVAKEDQGSNFKKMLDALHFRKIDMADEIIVVTDENGYIGESTRREMVYAIQTGKFNGSDNIREIPSSPVVVAEEDAKADPFKALHDEISFSSLDWGACKDTAVIYGIICGWDDDNPLEGEDPHASMKVLASRFGWSTQKVESVRRLRGEWIRRTASSAVRAGTESPTDPAGLTDKCIVGGVPIASNGRGFHVYGARVSTDYGAEIRVYESSAASGPHVWMSVTPGSVQSDKDGAVAAHMDVNQTRAVIARLQAWLDEIPTRWASSTDG